MGQLSVGTVKMATGIFRFEDFELDPAAYELRQSGRKVRIERIPLDVLITLAEHEGELVLREEILERVWGKDVFVDADNAINTAVRKIRLALKDNPENPRYLHTIAGKGYRFVGSKTQLQPETVVAPAMKGHPDSTIAASRSRPRIWLLGAALAVALAIGAFAFTHVLRRPTPPSTKIMLAVLPFQNLSNDPNQEYFGDGLTEETINDLGALSPERLGVIARTSAMVFKHTNLTASQLGKELGVDYLLEGSVRREGTKARISVQLIRAKDQTRLWGENYDSEADNLLHLQSEIGKAIAQRVELNLTPQQELELVKARAVDPEAYDLYFKGLYHWNMLTPAEFKLAITYFQQGIAKDPKYAPAYAGLADCYIMLPMIDDAPPRESFPAAQVNVNEALSLDDKLAQAHDSLARIKFFYEWDWTASENETRRALALNQNSAMAHARYAHLLSNLGRHKESLMEADLALQLDPLSLIGNSLQGMFLYQARRYDSAEQQLRKTLEMNPHFWVTHMTLGRVYLQKGMNSQALAEFRLARQLSQNNSETVALIEYSLAVTGKHNEARSVLNELLERAKHGYVPPYDVALVYAGLGEKDRALEWLERAYEARDVHMVFLKVEPSWDTFRSIARFRDLLRRMKFEA